MVLVDFEEKDVSEEEDDNVGCFSSSIKAKSISFLPSFSFGLHGDQREPVHSVAPCEVSITIQRKGLPHSSSV